MPIRVHTELVFTVKDRCRVCYTCVRECPVKAIKIINGQAEVITSRCIGCGNCTRVCSQNAKIFLDTTEEAIKLIEGGQIKTACLAPSFPAEFSEIKDYKVLVGMLKNLGFDHIIEVVEKKLIHQFMEQCENIKNVCGFEIPIHTENEVPGLLRVIRAGCLPLGHNLQMIHDDKGKFGPHLSYSCANRIIRAHSYSLLPVIKHGSFVYDPRKCY